MSVFEEDAEAFDVLVPSSLEGWRTDRALALLTGRSRSECLKLVESGLVSVDGRVVKKPATPLASDQRLEALLPAQGSTRVNPEADVTVEVLVEDPDFLIVNKRPDQVVHPGAGRTRGTLVAGLLARYPEIDRLVELGLCEAERPGIVHRLDKGTSGVLVVARTPRGFASLASQAREHTMERVYWAVCEGHVEDERGVIDAPIGRSARVPTMMAVRADGRPARTHYVVVERIEAPKSTLLELRLETGRTHQIRVHLAAIQHPVLNDLRYGHRRDRRLSEGRFFLHSRSLTLRHPEDERPVSAVAPLPEDLRAAVGGSVWS